MNDLIGCWAYVPSGNILGIIERVTGYYYIGGRGYAKDGVRILRTRSDWQVTDSDGTVWEAWEDNGGYICLMNAGFQIDVMHYLYLSAQHEENNRIKRQLCAAMHIPIQPWEVRKQWED